MEVVFHFFKLSQLFHQQDERLRVVAACETNGDSHFKDLSWLNLFRSNRTRKP